MKYTPMGHISIVLMIMIYLRHVSPQTCFSQAVSSYRRASLIGIYLRGRRSLSRTRIVSPVDKLSNCVPRYIPGPTILKSCGPHKKLRQDQ